MLLAPMMNFILSSSLTKRYNTVVLFTTRIQSRIRMNFFMLWEGHRALAVTRCKDDLVHAVECDLLFGSAGSLRAVFISAVLCAVLESFELLLGMANGALMICSAYDLLRALS